MVKVNIPYFWSSSYNVLVFFTAKQQIYDFAQVFVGGEEQNITNDTTFSLPVINFTFSVCEACIPLPTVISILLNQEILENCTSTCSCRTNITDEGIVTIHIYLSDVPSDNVGYPPPWISPPDISE